MRINREILLKLAQDTVAQRVHSDHSIIAAYLHGSLLEENPLLGGTTDVDLFIVHDEVTGIEREIVRITEDIHLDISHYARKNFRQVRDLRAHPWSGPTLYGCKILHDPQHFLDFVQASVRGQFERPDHILERARPQAEQARRMWLSFTVDAPPPGFKAVTQYLDAVEHGANAIALLSGMPLTERRFLINFPLKAQAIGRPGLSVGLLGLLGGPLVDGTLLRSWLPGWRAAFDAIRGDIPPVFLPARLSYYLRAFEALMGSEQPQMVLWPLLRTWTRLISGLTSETPALTSWNEAMVHLGLLGEVFPDKIAALDAYIDTVEETLEDWARENGA